MSTAVGHAVRRGWARTPTERRRRLVKVGLVELMLVVAVTAVTIAAPWGSATVAYVLLAMAAVVLPLSLLG